MVQPRTRNRDDLRLLGETVLVIVLSWILLGWIFDRAITQVDGTVYWVPYLRSSLAAGADWTDHLYRFGVLGGSAMHDSAGTLPLVQVCAALGLGATTTANISIVFLQTSIAFFGVLLVRGLASTWLAAPFELTRVQRVTVIWACAFAPWLGWRFAYGHENLVLGLLPLCACAGLIASARSAWPSPVALVLATFVVWNGLSGLGAQTLVYGVVFAGPIVAVLALGIPTAPRWGRGQAAIAAALVGGILLALPRLAGMIAHVASDDFPRTGSLAYSYAVSEWRDWLTSVPWTAELASASPIHERNVPIGPLVLLLLALPVARVSRPLIWTISICGALAILFASNVAPIADVLQAIPPMSSFRVPSRALSTVLVLVTPVALAACYARLPRPPARAEAVGLLIAVATIAGGRFVPGLVRESVALVVTLAIIVLVRWRPQLAERARVGAAVIVLAALGLCAFDERFPRQLPTDRIEDGPRALRASVIAELPELAMPLARIQIADPTRPYEMSTAFAAGLSSIDGAWLPTRRFIALLSALGGTEIASTAVVFRLTKHRAFPILQQLYNVRHVLVREGDGNVLRPLPATPGPAWFPRRIEIIDRGAEMARALGSGAKPGETAWLLRGDHTSAPLSCGGGTVGSVTVDDLGQTATLEVANAERCVLVVATNFVRSLHATIGTTELPVFAIDLALTGIEVPAGRAVITLAPRATIPLWARAAFFLGLALLVTAIVVARVRRR